MSNSTPETGEVRRGARLADGGDQWLPGVMPCWRGAQHDGRAMRVVGAHVDRLVMAAQSLEAHPHVRLDVLHQVAKVDRPVGIGQGAGDKNLAGFAHGNRLHW